MLWPPREPHSPAPGFERLGRGRLEVLHDDVQLASVVQLHDGAGGHPRVDDLADLPRLDVRPGLGLLVLEPAILLLDEPLGALDLKLRQGMQIELKRIQREVGITFIYVTHDQDEALTMSDRIAVFNEGRIEQVGPPAQVYERPRTEFVAGFVGVSNLLERDGRTHSIRPEKIRILDEGAQPEPGAHVESGRIREVVYAGMATRYIVELDDGGELNVVVQNLETTSAQALEARGRAVRLQWRPEHSLTLETRGTKEKG